MTVLERLRDGVSRLDVVGQWAEATERQLQAPAFQRDPDFIGRLLPWMERFAAYFDAEVLDFDRVPKGEPVLLVGNHSGGTITPDTAAFIAHWYRERGLDDPLVGLGFDAAFSIPGFNTLMRKIGQIPASRENARRALTDGATVLVYPGGFHEVFRPWSDRNRIDFAGRMGFVKVALETGVPVVPIVGHGGHETTVVLSRGEAVGKLFGNERIRVGGWPVLLQLPWGVSTPLTVGLPLPAKIRVQVLEPLDWSRFGPDDAGDPAVLQACYDEITSRMQAQLTRMAEEVPRPLMARLRKLWRR